jgi:hypothetical protein
VKKHLIVADAVLPPALKTRRKGYWKIPQSPLVMSQGNVWRFVKGAISIVLTQKPVSSAVALCP